MAIALQFDLRVIRSKIRALRKLLDLSVDYDSYWTGKVDHDLEDLMYSQRECILAVISPCDFPQFSLNMLREYLLGRQDDNPYVPQYYCLKPKEIESFGVYMKEYFPLELERSQPVSWEIIPDLLFLDYDYVLKGRYRQCQQI